MCMRGGEKEKLTLARNVSYSPDNESKSQIVSLLLQSSSAK